MPTISEILDSFQSSYRIDPIGIYCLVTGKKIGTTDHDELTALIESLPDTDPEDCADDFAMRLFASMRPSMRWNKMRAESLDQMRKVAPVETMAYLLNRLFSTIDIRQSYITEHGSRIKLFAHLDQLTNTGDELESFNTILHQLLEIDAKLGLKNLSCPFTSKSVVACDSFTAITLLVDPWHTTMQTKIEADVREARFAIANPLAKTAFFRSFMESKPHSKSATRMLHKAEEMRFFEEIFANISGEKFTPEIQVGLAKQAQKPKTIVKSTQMPRTFGVKRTELSS